MSEQDYASKDLKRRPFKSALVLVSMITVVAATTFLFLFSNVLLDVNLFLTGEGPISSLSIFFESFIWAILLLSVILGVVVISSTISLEMTSRRKDIALMKAIGTTIDMLYDHFVTQAVILLLGSIVFGVAIGSVLYMFGLMWLSSVLQGFEFVFSFPILQIGILTVFYLIAGYFVAQKPVYDTVNDSPIDALNPEVGRRVHRSGFFDNFGLHVKIATRGAGRRFRGTRRTMISLFLSITLASILWIGGGVVETTTDTYVSRAMGENILAVGDPDLLEQYYGAYSLYGENVNSSFNFGATENTIPSTLIDELATESGIAMIEQRYIDYVPIEELPAIIWVEDPTNPENGYYTTVGGNRKSSTLVMGVDMENTVSDWYYEGDMIRDQFDVWIGGQLANTMFDDPLIQNMQVYGYSLNVSGIMFDILNGGDVAIASLSLLETFISIDGPNLLLIQLDAYDSSTIARIEALVESSGTGFGVFKQQELLEQNKLTINSFWALLLPLPVMALVSAFLGLMNYLLVSIFSRFHDYVIMRSVGAKPSFIAKSMIAEGIDIGVRAGVPGIIVGTLFSIFFLVPEAAVPSLLYLPVAITVMIIAMVAVVILASIPVYLLFNSRTDLRVSEFQV